MGTKNKKMKKINRKKLAAVFRDMANYVSSVEEMTEKEFGDSRKKEAAKLADLMISNNIISKDDRDNAIHNLVFNKKATFDGMKALANQLRNARSKVATNLGSGSNESKNRKQAYKDPREDLIERFVN